MAFIALLDWFRRLGGKDDRTDRRCVTCDETARIHDHCLECWHDRQI